MCIDGSEVKLWDGCRIAVGMALGDGSMLRECDALMGGGECGGGVRRGPSATGAVSAQQGAAADP